MLQWSEVEPAEISAWWVLIVFHANVGMKNSEHHKIICSYLKASLHSLVCKTGAIIACADWIMPLCK